MYGIVDDLSSNPLIAAPRTDLRSKAVTVGGGRSSATSIPSKVDYTAYRGWYFDLPGAGERVNAVALRGLRRAGVHHQPALHHRLLLAELSLRGGPHAAAASCPAAAFAPGETAWSGKSLGQSLASRPVIVVLPNGGVQSITHKSDTSLTSSRLPVQLGGKVKKVGWKEIFR